MHALHKGGYARRGASAGKESIKIAEDQGGSRREIGRETFKELGKKGKQNITENNSRVLGKLKNPAEQEEKGRKPNGELKGKEDNIIKRTC